LLNHSHPELAGAEYVVFADSSRRYRDCSEGVSPLLGYTRAEMLEMTVDEVSLHNKEVPKLFGLYLRQGRMEGEYVLRDKTGTPIPIRYRAFVFPDGRNDATWEPIKDRRALYLGALLELGSDPSKLRQRIDIALTAVYVRMGESTDPGEKSDLAGCAVRTSSITEEPGLRQRKARLQYP
jgi:PAS domain-containing protein